LVVGQKRRKKEKGMDFFAAAGRAAADFNDCTLVLASLSLLPV